ncbi:MAG TPA: sulfite exporter TauE/SafE family protein [Acidimicrobiia bacterium]
MSTGLQVVLSLLLGVATGVLSAMFGVGGAVISTPGIRALGATPLQGIGSTLPSIFPSSITGTLRYHREGLVRWRAVRWTAAFGAPAAVVGSLVTSSIPGKGHLQMIATAALVGFTAYRTGKQPAERPSPVERAGAPVVGESGTAPTATATASTVGWWCYAVIGTGAGLLSGLLGVGGGILMVPAFQGWLRMGLKETIATSLACVGLLAIPGTITHTLKHHIDWTFALPLCVGVVPGARIGARLAIKAADRSLRRITGIVLGTIAVVYAAAELIALVR